MRCRVSKNLSLMSLRPTLVTLMPWETCLSLFWGKCWLLFPTRNFWNQRICLRMPRTELERFLEAVKEEVLDRTATLLVLKLFAVTSPNISKRGWCYSLLPWIGPLHSWNSYRLMHIYVDNLRSALLPSDAGTEGGFGRSVNPIPTGGGQIIPTYYYCTPLPPKKKSPSGITAVPIRPLNLRILF